MVDFFCKLEPKDWVVLIGIIITAMFSLGNFILSIRRTKLENITKYRVEWISKFRCELSDFLGFINYEGMCANSFEFKSFSEYKSNLYKKKDLILFYLNFKGKIDLKIENSINKIVDSAIIILNLLRLRVVCYENKGVKSLIFKQHIQSIGDECYIKFLFNYAINNNKYTELSDESMIKINKNELKKKIVAEYCSVINAQEFFNKFFNDIDGILSLKLDDINEEMNELIRNIRIYLKSEWNRVKRESNMFFRMYKEEKEIEKLINEYKKVL